MVAHKAENIRADILGTAGAAESIAAPGRKHYPALDGLRGLAILLVLCDHIIILQVLTRGGFIGKAISSLAALFGWLGVDLFFVLSGFLITGILFDAKDQVNYFRNFYARRFLRIFPLYYAFLFLLLLFLVGSHVIPSRFGMPDVTAQYLWSAQPWLWTYTFNIWLGMARNPEPNLTGQLWSLSIEEQFYLVWPLLVVILSRKAILRACVGVIIGALAARIIMEAAGCRSLQIYTATWCRVDTLAMGALLAMLARGPGGLEKWRGLAGRLMFVTGVTLATAVMISLWHMHTEVGGSALGDAGSDAFTVVGGRLYVVQFTIIGLFFASSMLLVLSDIKHGWLSLLTRFFSSKPMRFMGGYSYGMYVYHLFLLAVVSRLLHLNVHPAWVQRPEGYFVVILLDTLLIVVVAFASYHLFEKQFLKLKRYFPEKA